ncbi:MAG: lipoate protein ligase C-terminal domain-containing protein [Candidatus Thorarchaeota archaeon]
MRISSYKVPEGKLVKVKLWVDSDRIQQITIHGDFFLHPEDAIQTIEKSLVGSLKDSKLIEKTITRIMEESGAILIGASSKDLATAIMMAWESQ